MTQPNTTGRIMARLSDHEPGLSLPPHLSPAMVTSQLQGNKYPLLALDGATPDWLQSAPCFQHAYAEEREWLETQHREYVKVLEAWRKQDIPALMIKSAGNAPSFPYTSDNIDILVPPARGLEARDMLRALGYSEIRTVEEPWKYLFRKFHNGRSVSAIHLHEQVAWLVGFMDEAALWERMRPSPDDPLVNVPSPEDAILINLAHACYENKLLRLNDLVRVRHALRTAGPSLDWDYMERVAASRGWRDGLAFMVLTYAMLESALFSTRLLPEARCAHFARLAAADRPVQLHLELLHRGQSETLPLDLGYWFCKRLYYRKILADPQRTVSQRWRDAVITVPWGVKLKSRLRPQPGLLVSLSGPDGTGKTAHGTALVDALRLSSVTTNYVWARGGSTGLAALVSRVRRAGRVERPDPECADVETDAQSPGPDAVARRRVLLARRPLLRFAWSWMVAVDQVAAYTLRAKIPAILGRVVVADRYVYDTAVEMDASLPADASWSRRAIETMLRLAPRPDLAYVFDVTPETARERKPDEPWHSSYNDERVAYRRLAERFRMRQLSNDGSFAQANDRLIHEVLQAFMADFETPLNAVFFANPSQHNPTDPCWMRGGPS